MGMTVELVTPAGTVEIPAATAVEFQSADGGVGILPGHAAMIGTIDTGILAIATPAGKRRYVTGSGLARIADDRVSLMLLDLLPENEIVAEQALVEYQALAASLTAPSAPAADKERLRDLRLAEAKLAILGIKPPH